MLIYSCKAQTIASGNIAHPPNDLATPARVIRGLSSLCVQTTVQCAYIHVDYIIGLQFMQSECPTYIERHTSHPPPLEPHGCHLCNVKRGSYIYLNDLLVLDRRAEETHLQAVITQITTLLRVDVWALHSEPPSRSGICHIASAGDQGWFSSGF